MGVSVADIAAGVHLTQGILAALLRRTRTQAGGLVEVSLLASAMDLQFEQVTAYWNGDGNQPARSALNGANVHAVAPYGLYETADGYIAVAMTPIARLVEVLDVERLAQFSDPGLAYERRDEIKTILASHFKTVASNHWLEYLEPAGVWCAGVLDWHALEASGALDALDVVQTFDVGDGVEFRTTT